MRRFLNIALLAALGVILSGCQPFMKRDRLDRGLAIVLTGIEGGGLFSTPICRGLDDGGVNWGIERVDWTHWWRGALGNLRNEAANRREAEDLAAKVVRYQTRYPGRPVMLVGQSGGAAMAVWIAESLPEGVQVDGIVLLAAALSPEYRLDAALEKSRLGIVSFHSKRDWFILGFGTTLFGTMDGRQTEAAGMVGFSVPPGGVAAKAYQKLYQVAWTEEMEKTGNWGGHLTSGRRAFVSRYVAPLVLLDRWSEVRVNEIIRGPEPRSGGP